MQQGSPAIGSGLLARAPANDERGFPSTVNGLINVGASSAVIAALPSSILTQSVPHLIVTSMKNGVTTTTYYVNSTADILNPPAGVLTLRAAIQDANTTPGNKIINLTVSGTYQIMILGSFENNNATGDFDILPSGGNVSIVNASKGQVIVDGNHLDRVFDINPNFDPANPTAPFTVTLTGFTITGGIASDAVNGDGPNASGGGIRDIGNASLVLNNMLITGNTATADGGGVVMENTMSVPWTLTVNNSVISNNHAGDAGGGIDVDGSGQVFLNSGTVITGNTSVNQGAGIWLDAIHVGTIFQTANLMVANVLFSNNQALAAGNVGGGIGNAGNGIVTIENSTLFNNFSGGVGGGFGDENAQGTLIVVNSLFLNNVSQGSGGGIAAGGPSTSITSSELKGNASGLTGGGLFANGVSLMIKNSTFASNVASGDGMGLGGGGIELETTGTTTLTSSTITGNLALNNAGANGGGIDAPATMTGDVTLLNDTINANLAANGGGIFWAGNGMFGLQNTIVAQNFIGQGGTGPDLNNPAGTFLDNDGNLIGLGGPNNGNTGLGGAFGGLAGTQVGTITALDALLALLGNYGGPSIGWIGMRLILETEALNPGSPAIGKGVVTGAPATDERGFPSVVNHKVNVGAF